MRVKGAVVSLRRGGDVDGGLAGERPRCMPLIPSVFHLLRRTSTAEVYTRFPPSLASSPWSCSRVLATSAL